MTTDYIVNIWFRHQLFPSWNHTDNENRHCCQLMIQVQALFLTHLNHHHCTTQEDSYICVSYAQFLLSPLMLMHYRWHRLVLVVALTFSFFSLSLSSCKQGQWALLGPRGKQMVLSFNLKCMSVPSLQGFVCMCVAVVCLCFNGGNNNWCRVLQSSEQMVTHSCKTWVSKSKTAN